LSGSEPAAAASGKSLRVTIEMNEGCILFDWTNEAGAEIANGTVRCTGPDELSWELAWNGNIERETSRHHRSSIRSQCQRWQRRFPVAENEVSALRVRCEPGTCNVLSEKILFEPADSRWDWIELQIVEMAQVLGMEFSPLGKMLAEMEPFALQHAQREVERLRRAEQQLQREIQRRQETMERQAAKRRRRAQRDAQARREAARSEARAQTSAKSAAPETPTSLPAPVPAVPWRMEMPELSFQETAFNLADLRGWRLTEQAMRWWISNQSDDLLALPFCRIQKLDYQVRTALRVLGPLRGRALLSDEVGLGKTIEAGLVLKEWLTRGMVKRFLVLTVPSLVDQWEEELNDKFGLVTVTTNGAAFRSDPELFWRGNPGIIASLHTLKHPAHLAIARAVHWDLVIVDEAHHLRNRESQAWQAVNALPRQFLLLLTATPVQNSLEELYNLVTLLQPGQLPTPKEFRARFFDPKKPRQPREPEELRRLLGQVMIRNTRANADVNLPPRRAETILFEAEPDERAFWESWESSLRTEMGKLPASQASLWGRLLLQAAGSSPAAWRKVLEKFPHAETARDWRGRAPLENSWRRKCALLPPLTRVEGGLVVFSQFLETQAAVAEALRAANVQTFVINGATPTADRHGITEQFRKAGGALLLTHSGTEGRNLQFCHSVLNFDLPWNPMEIEQRIGRLHRLGQKHPVRIYNLVQSGSLQEHILEILQEKLNLFELVVGETGLVLGERFGSDEFAEEVLRRWREAEGTVGPSMEALGNELLAARHEYEEVKQLDATLFAKDYETL
jgi:SNF2 family DNA or RNA helicase